MHEQLYLPVNQEALRTPQQQEEFENSVAALYPTIQEESHSVEPGILDPYQQLVHEAALEAIDEALASVESGNGIKDENLVLARDWSDNLDVHNEKQKDYLENVGSVIAARLINTDSDAKQLTESRANDKIIAERRASIDAHNEKIDTRKADTENRKELREQFLYAKQLKHGENYVKLFAKELDKEADAHIEATLGAQDHGSIVDTQKLKQERTDIEVNKLAEEPPELEEKARTSEELDKINKTVEDADDSELALVLAYAQATSNSLMEEKINQKIEDRIPDLAKEYGVSEQDVRALIDANREEHLERYTKDSKQLNAIDAPGDDGDISDQDDTPGPDQDTVSFTEEQKERAIELMESLGFPENEILVLRANGKAGNGFKLIDAYDSENGPCFVVEKIFDDGSKPVIRVLYTEGLLKLTEKYDKHMVSLRRQRKFDDPVAEHKDAMYEEGARTRNEMRASQGKEDQKKVGTPLSARFGAWVTTRASSMKEKWDSMSKKGVIAAVGSAALAIAGIRYAPGLLENVSSPSRVGKIDALPDNIFNNMNELLSADTPVSVVDMPGAEVVEPRSINVNHNEGFTQVFDRLATNRGYNLRPDQLYDIYNQMPGLESIDGTYRMPNGDLGISGSSIELSAEQQEEFEKLLKKYKR